MRIRFVSLFLALSVLAACGDDDDAPAVDLGVDAPLNVPPESCAQRGDVGNENGVGTFCTPSGRECRAFPLAGLCLASAAPAENQWFCTRLCERDDQCGSDARCFGDARGKSCVPTRCLDPEPADAGAGDDAAAGDDAGTADDAGAAADAGAADDAGASSDPGSGV